MTPANHDDKIDQIAEHSIQVVEDMVSQYSVDAIAALLGACVVWSCEYGGSSIIRESLQRAIDLTHKMDADRERDQ